MRTSETANQGRSSSLERMITTDMSARILSQLVERKWSIKRVAETIDAPMDFVERIRAKKQVFTWRDLKRIAKKVGKTPELVFFNSIDVRPGMEPLFDGMRGLLELSASPLHHRSQTKSPPRKRSKRAA